MPRLEGSRKTPWWVWLIVVILLIVLVLALDYFDVIPLHLY